MLRLRPNDMQMHIGGGREGSLASATMAGRTMTGIPATKEGTREIVPFPSFQRFSPSLPPLLVIVKRAFLAGGKIAALLLSNIGWLKKGGKESE